MSFDLNGEVQIYLDRYGKGMKFQNDHLDLMGLGFSCSSLVQLFQWKTHPHMLQQFVCSSGKYKILRVNVSCCDPVQKDHKIAHSIFVFFHHFASFRGFLSFVEKGGFSSGTTVYTYFI